MSTPTLVDGPALIQALRVEVATWQARSLGQRALIEAANAKQVGLVVAEATKLQGVYDEVVSRLYAVMDRVVASRPAAVGQQSNTVPSAAVMVARLPPKLQGVYAQATSASMSWMVRYVAVCDLILGMTKEDPRDILEQAEAVYDEARRNLGGLVQVSTTLRGMMFDTPAATSQAVSAIGSIEVAESLRQSYGNVESYTNELGSAELTLRSLAAGLSGGQLSRVVDAIANVMRLRPDLAVGLQLRHLKR